MCAINVCGFQNKLKFKMLEDYIYKFDIACLSETKCDTISQNEIEGYKSFMMDKKVRSHRYGGIHVFAFL